MKSTAKNVVNAGPGGQFIFKQTKTLAIIMRDVNFTRLPFGLTQYPQCRMRAVHKRHVV